MRGMEQMIANAMQNLLAKSPITAQVEQVFAQLKARFDKFDSDNAEILRKQDLILAAQGAIAQRIDMLENDYHATGTGNATD
jgi:hypothetical protein